MIRTRYSFRFMIPVFAGISILFSCGKKDEDPFVNKVPVLEFVSVSPQSATEFEDSLVFSIRYRDNDGDLGENDPEVKNLFLTDRRINLTYGYRIRQLAPAAQAVPITGTLEVILPAIARTDTLLDEEPAVFGIYVIDRAGNKSNEVVSPVVIVRKP